MSETTERFRFDSYELIEREDEYVCKVSVKGKQHYIHVHKSPIEFPVLITGQYCNNVLFDLFIGWICEAVTVERRPTNIIRIMKCHTPNFERLLAYDNSNGFFTDNEWKASCCTWPTTSERSSSTNTFASIG